MVVPPVSTIFGLISSAVGDYVSAGDATVGYLFRFGSQAIDLETIYQFGSKSSPLVTKSNVIRRQILFDNTLWLYVDDSRIAKAFLNPYFQLLLGRSNDLACVESVDRIELKTVAHLGKLQGTTVPWEHAPLSAPIQALPVSFTNEVPRKNLGTRPFFLLEYDYRQVQAMPVPGFLDSELQHEIYWHDYRKEIGR